VVWLVSISLDAPVAAPDAQSPAVVHLADMRSNQTGFKLEDVPRWLFLHVAVLAVLQAVSVLAAARFASREALSATDRGIIRFLCEIPMYLGLFGTLLGVCLTQFITGTLVAPLAYLTTMNGIVLHVLAKLFVMLPVDAEQGDVS
jgi:hypothetical protein